VRDIWDAKAAFWDERMGEGNQFQLELIGPAVERLLAVRPEEQILDVGCGNGVTSRRLAHLGARSWRLITARGFWSWPGRAREISRIASSTG
jgi:2-polyprenyl-3-methyl-5-hydroxy-6-metoxy-1,4-benzoquinol methylase